MARVCQKQIIVSMSSTVMTTTILTYITFDMNSVLHDIYSKRVSIKQVTVTAFTYTLINGCLAG